MKLKYTEMNNAERVRNGHKVCDTTVVRANSKIIETCDRAKVKII